MVSRSRLKLLGLPWVVGGLVLLEIFFPHRAWATMLVALGGAWLFAWWWARALGRGLRLQRERRFGLAQVGDQLEERFTATNSSFWPAPWFEVADQSTLPGYAVSRASSLGGSTTMQWTTAGICEHRGAFQLGPTRLRTGDPFGIYEVTIDYAASTPVFVMPPIIPLPPIEIAPGGRAGEGRPQRRALERTVSASAVRQFVSGDDWRWVHWPTSARRDTYYVRTFENTPAGDWWIMLDLDRAAQVGQGPQSTEEHAIMLAASLASRGLEQGQAVGLVTHGETLLRLAPQIGSGQRLDILRALATTGPGEVTFAELLTHARPPLRELASLILITSNVSGDWIEAVLPLLRRGAAPTVLVVDPASYGSNDDARPLLDRLTHLQISYTLMSREMLDQPEAHPGQSGLHWRVTPSGRAILTTETSELEWRVLG